jgi:UDP-N-acetylglucosamine--N-acetylmuramyl-(pentapeptide) pyrophosphoryl-undecaprenol N-acetylglucosamine transferase
MERFFPADKIILTGNPVREDISGSGSKRDEGYSYFGLEKGRMTILVLGGSLGSRTINNSILDGIGRIRNSGMQMLWQTGKYYYENIRIIAGENEKGICITDFINRMDLAFATADLIVSRAGAGTISELCIVGKPVVLVPSPNVAEDHQTKNALSLSEKGAALLVRDEAAPSELINTLLELAGDTGRMKKLAANISRYAIADADERIAREVLKLTE